MVSSTSILSKLMVYLQLLLCLVSSFRRSYLSRDVLTTHIQAVLYTFCHAVYNLYFHPLSRFPGPKIAAITRLYYVKYCVSGRLPFNNTKLHAKYGGIVRIAPDELSLNTAEGWRDVYGNRHGKPEMPKDKLFYGSFDKTSILYND